MGTAQLLFETVKAMRTCLKEQYPWELTNRETSSCEADPNWKLWLGVVLAMHSYQLIAFGTTSIECKA